MKVIIGIDGFWLEVRREVKFEVVNVIMYFKFRILLIIINVLFRVWVFVFFIGGLLIRCRFIFVFLVIFCNICIDLMGYCFIVDFFDNIIVLVLFKIVLVMLLVFVLVGWEF